MSGSPQVSTTHHWLAQAEVDLGDCEAARFHLRQAADVLTRSVGPDDLRAIELQAAVDAGGCQVPPLLTE